MMAFLKFVPAVIGRLVTAVTLREPSGHMSLIVSFLLEFDNNNNNNYKSLINIFIMSIIIANAPVVKQPFEVLIECVPVLVDETINTVSDLTCVVQDSKVLVEL